MSPKESAVPVRSTSTTNGVHEEEDSQDLFAGLFPWATHKEALLDLTRRRGAVR